MGQQLLCVRVIESDISDWSDRVRKRIERAQPKIVDGSEAGLQIFDPAKKPGRESLALEKALLHGVQRPPEGLGSLHAQQFSPLKREEYLGAEGTPKQMAIRNTHMDITMLACLNYKIDCKLLERVAMREMGQKLRTLVLEDCCIQDDDVSILAAGLKRISAHDTICKVRTLALTNNYITAKGAKVLATVLTSSTSLQELYIDWNNCGAEGCSHLADALVLNTSLQLLHLEANDTRDKGITHLAKSLSNNRALTDLDLATDNITAAGAEALGEMLLANTTLRSLSLNGNSIRSEGAAVIAAALERRNTALRMLSLDSTDIDVEFFVAMGKALRSPTCPLVSLSACRNTATDDGAQAIAYALASNTVLTSLRLACCVISHDCVSNILDVSGSVGNLAHLDLRDNAGQDRAVFLLAGEAAAAGSPQLRRKTTWVDLSSDRVAPRDHVGRLARR